MLVLTRRTGESIVINNNIKLTVVNVGPGRVKIGIEAPPSVRIDREEVHTRILQEQAEDVLDAVAATLAHADQATIVTGPDTGLLAGAPATPAEEAAAPRLSNFRRKPR